MPGDLSARFNYQDEPVSLTPISLTNDLDRTPTNVVDLVGDTEADDKVVGGGIDDELPRTKYPENKSPEGAAGKHNSKDKTSDTDVNVSDVLSYTHKDTYTGVYSDLRVCDRGQEQGQEQRPSSPPSTTSAGGEYVGTNLNKDVKQPTAPNTALDALRSYFSSAVAWEDDSLRFN